MKKIWNHVGNSSNLFWRLKFQLQLLSVILEISDSGTSEMEQGYVKKGEYQRATRKLFPCKRWGCSFSFQLQEYNGRWLNHLRFCNLLLKERKRFHSSQVCFNGNKFQWLFVVIAGHSKYPKTEAWPQHLGSRHQQSNCQRNICSVSTIRIRDDIFKNFKPVLGYCKKVRIFNWLIQHKLPLHHSVC